MNEDLLVLLSATVSGVPAQNMNPMLVNRRFIRDDSTETDGLLDLFG